MSRKVTIDWDKASRMFGDEPNATFDKLPTREYFEGLMLPRVIRGAIEERMNYLVIGPSGCGKTEFLKSFAECVSVDGIPAKLVYFSAVLMSVENMKVSFPYTMTRKDKEETALRYLLDMRLREQNPIIVVWDEIGQADRELFSGLMESLSEGTFGNQRPFDMVAQFMLDNPHTCDYGRLSAMEFAQADRFSTVTITSADSPWPYAFAAAHPTINLKKAIDFHNRFPLSEGSREVASPRLLTQGITLAITRKVPPRYALPILGGTRVVLTDTKDNDVTDSYLNGIANAMGVPVTTTLSNPIETALDLVVSDGISVYIEGNPGTAKTSKVKAHFAEHHPDVAVPYLSVANSTKEGVVVPFPTESAGDPSQAGAMDQLTYDFLLDERPTVLIADEFSRGIDDRVTNVFNEIVQNKTVNGRKLDTLLGTVAINNPPTFQGENLDVRHLTLPQATRFSLSLQVGANETGAYEWLLNTYGELMGPFVDWHKEAFRNEEAREAVSPRTLERMFRLWRQDLPLHHALARPNNEAVEAPISDLLVMLAKQPLARISVTARDVERYEVSLAERTDDGDPVHPADHLAVFKSFSHAELSQLEKYEPEVRRLFPNLLQEYQLKLLLIKEQKLQAFWYAILGA